MNNEEKDIERQEFARRVGKNGDRILMEYFDDIGLANKTNNEINDLKSELISNLSPFLTNKTGRCPIILPIIMEIKNN